MRASVPRGGDDGDSPDDDDDTDSKYVACIIWENGEITIEPLRSIVGMELTSGLRHEPTQ